MKKSFTVRASMKEIANIVLGFAVFFAFGLFWLIFKNGVDPVLASVITGPLIFTCLLGFLYLTLFRVTVKGSSIEFRNLFGITRTIDVKDIDKVIWRVNETKFGQSEKITVKSGTAGFSVETLMDKSEKFYEFIQENVSEDKIIRKTGKLNK